MCLQGAAERFKNFKLSVEKAKEAVSMDVSDGISWCKMAISTLLVVMQSCSASVVDVLGNAYLSLFFISGNSDSLLKQCMTAYAQAVGYNYKHNYGLIKTDWEGHF